MINIILNKINNFSINYIIYIMWKKLLFIPPDEESKRGNNRRRNANR